MFEQVKNLLVEKMGVKAEITPESELSKDLGINSLEIADLFQICEDTFGIVIDDEEVNDFVTVGDIVNYLESKKG
ncbi:MAG: acyl carrier protein [Clostridia bacterium]|nr:acyl carrier protein [Clostridia bacterium]